MKRLKLHDNHHIFYAFIHMWVSVFENFKWNFQPNQKKTHFYIKWCNKKRFVPHSHIFISDFCWATSWTNYYKQCDILNKYSLYKQFRMVQLRMSCSTMADNSPNGNFTNWPIFLSFIFFPLDGFNFSAWRVVSFNLS